VGVGHERSPLVIEMAGYQVEEVREDVVGVE
jgi:hypothetical protein